MTLMSTALLISATTRSATYCWTRGSLASGPNVSKRACALVSCSRVQSATTATGDRIVAIAMSSTATTGRHRPRDGRWTGAPCPSPWHRPSPRSRRGPQPLVLGREPAHLIGQVLPAGLSRIAHKVPPDRVGRRLPSPNRSPQHQKSARDHLAFSFHALDPAAAAIFIC